MQIFLATARKKRRFFFHCILSRIVFLFCWLTFPFSKVVLSKVERRKFWLHRRENLINAFSGLVEERQQEKEFVCVHKKYQFVLVDEKQTEKPNIYALALRKKNGKSVIQLELYTKQELRKNLSQLKQTNHQVGQMLSPQIKVCFT